MSLPVFDLRCSQMSQLPDFDFSKLISLDKPVNTGFGRGLIRWASPNTSGNVVEYWNPNVPTTLVDQQKISDAVYQACMSAKL